MGVQNEAGQRLTEFSQENALVTANYIIGLQEINKYGRTFVTLYRRQGSRPSPRKDMQKATWLSEDTLQTAVKRREMKCKGKKRKIFPFECRVPKNSKER